MIDSMVVSALARNEPELYLVYKSLEKELVDDPEFTSSTNGRKLWFGRKFFSRSWIGQYFLLIHELLHVVYNHPVRMKVYGGRLSKLFNRMADAKINYQIIKVYPKARSYLIDYSKWIPPFDLENLSVEELMVRYGGATFPLEEDVLVAGDGVDLGFASLMGSGYGGWKGRIFRRFEFKPDDTILDLRARLDRVFSRVVSVVSRDFVSDTFGVPSRRSGLPEYRWFGHGRVSVVIDVSGSVSDYVLNRFGSFARLLEAQQYVYFDEGVRLVSDDFKPITMGGGGTYLSPALDVVNADVVVVVSDGRWRDDMNLVRERLKRFELSVLVSNLKCYDWFDYCFKI